MQCESQKVLDKQIEIFKKLRYKAEKIDSGQVKALDTNSDYMMEDITPMGEIFQPFSPMGEVNTDQFSGASSPRMNGASQLVAKVQSQRGNN